MVVHYDTKMKASVSSDAGYFKVAKNANEVIGEKCSQFSVQHLS